MRIFGAMVIIGSCLIGCGSTMGVVTTSTNMPTATHQPSAVLSATKIAVLTATQTSTATTTPSNLLAATQTPPVIPTLTAAESATLTPSLLTTNGGCKLPCWWGIQPGISQHQQVAEMFLKQPYHDVENAFASFSAGIPSLNDPVGYHIKVEVELSNTVVSNIFVFGEINSEQATINLARDWQGIAWDRVLKDYGAPDHVFVNMGGSAPEAGAPALYTLNMLYEKQGFEVGYVGLMTFDTKAKVYQACPVFGEVTQIHLTLAVPGKPNNLKELLEKRYGNSHFAGSLESITGVNIQTFYQQFKDTSRKVCLNSITPSSQ